MTAHGCHPEFLSYQRSDFTVISFHAHKEGLGRPKAQKHVETRGDAKIALETRKNEVFYLLSRIIYYLYFSYLRW